ncbi:MAG: addiction module protein [Verrucomicrobia bacterium]|nr:addiction module protein [Verrucomicrobiota bacterium]
MKLVDLPEVRALPPSEKLELADELWTAAARDLEAMGVPPEQREILDRRWSDFLHDPSSALTLEQFQERLRELRP